MKTARAGSRVKKRRLRKRVKYTLVFLLVAFLSVAGYGTYLYIKTGAVVSDAFEDDGRGKSDLREDYVDPKFDHVSVLIMGIDENDARKEKEIARTDALILATLNKDEKSIKLLSIPRDSYVYIPEVGYEDKINHAHAFGGTTATIDAVENLLQIPVDYYVKLNFNAFIEVVDAIDGVTVDVPYEIKELNSTDQKEAIHLLEGRQSLDGEEALAFVRTRKQDSDVERGKRQMEVIDAIINKSTSLSSVFKYDDIIDAVGNNMSTNMTFMEMKSFFSYGTQGNKLQVESLSLEGEDYQPANVYYWKLDDESLEETVDKLKRHLELSSYVDSNGDFQSADVSN